MTQLRYLIQDSRSPQVFLKVKSAWPRAMGQGPGHPMGPMGAAFLLGSWSLALAFTDCQDSAVLKKVRDGKGALLAHFL